MNLVFIAGLTLDSALDAQLVEENKKRGDVLIADFVDNYYNLTFKSLVAWRWIKYKCGKASFYLKLDHDVLMNTRKVMNALRDKSVFKREPLAFYGNILYASYPLRHPMAKWYVSYTEFSEWIYKPYAHGPNYFMSNQLVPWLYNATLRSRDFWMVRFL
jgi:hypothetical protein